MHSSLIQEQCEELERKMYEVVKTPRHDGSPILSDSSLHAGSPF